MTSRSQTRKQRLPYIIAFFALLLLLGSGWAYRLYLQVFEANVPGRLEAPYLYIAEGTTYEELVNQLIEEGFIENEKSFRDIARWRKFDQAKIRSGRYLIEPKWSNYELINHLRSGTQATVKVVLHNERLIEEVAGKVSGYIEPDSLSLLKQMKNNATLSELGLSQERLMTLFIPNTYDFFWNTSAKSFLKRMKKENERFWQQKERLEKAEKMGMSPEEVYILASIVDRETLAKSEKKRVAGLYLNRLRKGIRLQADPTAVFATRDFDARRVLNYHIEFDSPYNTYLYPGLPPGPIGMASISGIDAVLNAEKHDYLYMCAKPDNSGLHAFAKTLEAHNANARKYRRWLSRQGILH
jgi:UPF0755 protein